MVDIPINTDEAAEIIIYGVESEQIEEENDAYNDMRYELGEVDNKSNSNFYVEKSSMKGFQEFMQKEKMSLMS